MSFLEVQESIIEYAKLLKNMALDDYKRAKEVYELSWSANAVDIFSDRFNHTILVKAVRQRLAWALGIKKLNDIGACTVDTLISNSLPIYNPKTNMINCYAIKASREPWNYYYGEPMLCNLTNYRREAEDDPMWVGSLDLTDFTVLTNWKKDFYEPHQTKSKLFNQYLVPDEINFPAKKFNSKRDPKYCYQWEPEDVFAEKFFLYACPLLPVRGISSEGFCELLQLGVFQFTKQRDYLKFVFPTNGNVTATKCGDNYYHIPKKLSLFIKRLKAKYRYAKDNWFDTRSIYINKCEDPTDLKYLGRLINKHKDAWQELSAGLIR